MSATYRQFLASPSAALLADNASLHYQTTTTSITGPEQIIKHIVLTQKQVSKKKEEVLHIVEGQNALALELDTALEFRTSGGPYLPGLDDNFITDRTAYLPITHFVLLSGDGKISQIRVSWDQGSLLKQMEIIGKSGRNWPIKDGREQLALIQSSLKSGGSASGASAQEHKAPVTHARGQSTNVLRDPHATLHMQATREELENIENERIASPYAGNRPKQRSFMEVFGDGTDDAEGSSRQQNMSPGKGGSGKNFQPMRLFDGQEDVEEEDTPKGGNANRYVRPNPGKYTHFDFADGNDPQDAPKPGVPFDQRTKTKKDSQWSFDDFTTPSKPKPGKTIRHQDVRHWDTDRETFAGETPAQAGKARRDAEAHFELQDDGERVVRPDRPGTRAKGSVHNEQLGLYKNKLFDQEEATPDAKRALGNITNLNHRGKDFDPHFSMADESPSHQHQSQAKLPETRQKAVKMMDANWSAYDESPKQKENSRVSKSKDDTGINIAGDGMGGRKGTDRSWLYGDEQEQDLPKPTTGRRAGPSAQARSLWDF